ncbi:MAG TPA: TIM barrel protein [Clostridia bacterium]|nr:TIM barrel protein [Clostridia bacterium]
MLKFSPCIEMMFTSEPFMERFAAVRAAGLDCAEFWGWTHRDPAQLKEASEKSAVKITSMCIGTKDTALDAEYGKKALLAPDSGQVLVKVVEESIEMAKFLGVPALIITTGQEREDVSHEQQHDYVVEALRAAAPLFEKSGIMAVLEPLNILCDHKGYFLSSGYEAFDIIREVNSPKVKLLYDIYHQQITEGNLIPNIRKYIDLIGHFHVADNPGRNQPGTGEINYKNVFAAIDALNYDGYVGLEYSPTIDDTLALKNTVALAESV